METFVHQFVDPLFAFFTNANDIIFNLILVLFAFYFCLRDNTRFDYFWLGFFLMGLLNSIVTWATLNNIPELIKAT
jgi:predicted PurR-regulated permease PerM